MTPETRYSEDTLRIRRTWADVALDSDAVGRLFYQRLFEIAPETQHLFASDMAEQSGKLMQTLNWIVDHLDKTSDLHRAASALAVRHVHFGVAAAQYATVGQVLISSLDESLGDAFTAEDAAAWGRVYGALSGLMIEVAYPDEQSAST